mmetsp:Transcript_6038/g.15813  ORF Transcript_6038/g.15813 Transcript_6038/m.15813 type:complete len:233 (-) Transcript_6038:28-726(-)
MRVLLGRRVDFGLLFRFGLVALVTILLPALPLQVGGGHAALRALRLHGALLTAHGRAVGEELARATTTARRWDGRGRRDHPRPTRVTAATAAGQLRACGCLVGGAHLARSALLLLSPLGRLIEARLGHQLGHPLALGRVVLLAFIVTAGRRLGAVVRHRLALLLEALELIVGRTLLGLELALVRVVLDKPVKAQPGRAPPRRPAPVCPVERHPFHSVPPLRPFHSVCDDADV